MLVFATRAESAQGASCARAEIAPTAAQVDRARKALLGLPIGDGHETAVPPRARRLIAAMKRRLADFVDAYMRCLSAAADAKTIKRNLSARAHAIDLGTRIYRPDELPKGWDHYGYELSFDVRSHAGPPPLIGVVANFEIECGGDAVLLVYSREHGSWREILRRQSGPYATVGGAFGAFDYAISPPDKTGGWFIAAKHVAPWCSSNWSAIEYSVLRPVARRVEPRKLFSGTDPIYRGNEDDGRLSVGAKEFELRFHSASIDTGVHNRVWIQHFSVLGDRVRRMPPVAVSPRDFVDEWIVAPWRESRRWSSPGRIADLKIAHGHLHKIGFFDYDSVRRCADGADHYQIKLMRPDDRKPYFLQVLGRADYRMAAVSAEPAPSCNGENVLDTMATR